MTAGKLQKKFINGIEHYRNSPLVQKAIADMEAILAERERQHKENPAKETERPQPAVSHKDGEKSVPIPEADKAGADKAEAAKTQSAVQESKPAGNDGQTDNSLAVQESGGNKAQTIKKAAEPDKTAETAPKTNRDASGISKKQSVLNALRERQAKLREQEKQGQKSKARGKGGPEL